MIREPLTDEATLAGLEARADRALRSDPTGYNSLYLEWARVAKVLINELRRLRDEKEGKG